MLKWNNVNPDIYIPPLELLLGSYSYRIAIDIIKDSFSSPQVFIKKDTLENIHLHLRSSKAELGGLLLGKCYILPFVTSHGYDFVTMITQNIPSKSFENSSVSLRMGTEVWDRSKEFLANKSLMILGWYHSHPNIGAFFSGTDRYTQKHFFNNKYSIGLVIDPFRNDMAAFWGEKSDKIEQNVRIIEDEL